MSLRCVSLFSGCGGLDLGLQRAGFDIVFATDSDPLCAESHDANFGSPFLLGPVEEVDEKQLSAALTEPVDLLAGGPPCPPYSKSRFYRPDKPRALDDPVGDATLSGYLRVLSLVNPSVFLFENVSGFRFKVHNEALAFLESEASDLGYTTNWAVLNAADYGVPQIRERFFMIGSRAGRIEMPTATHAKQAGTTLLDGSLKPWVTAGEVLADLDTEANADDTGHYAGGQYHDELTQIPPGDNYLFFTEKRGHPEPIWKWRSRYWSFLLKLSPDLPSWTIQARRSNNMGPFHWRNRILRIGEVKRLQTIPDDWYLAGRIDDQWRQVGNAVPPVLAEALGAAIRCQIADFG